MCSTALVVSVIFSQFAVYEVLIVPRLAEWHGVPVGYWLLAMAFPAAICVGAALFCRSWVEVAWFCFVSSILITLSSWCFHAAGRPRFDKAFEDGISSWVVPLGLISICMLVLIGSLHTIRSYFVRPISASGDL